MTKEQQKRAEELFATAFERRILEAGMRQVRFVEYLERVVLKAKSLLASK